MKKYLLVALCFCMSFGAFASDVDLVFYSSSIVRVVKGGEAPASSYAITMTPQRTEVKVSKTASKTVYRTASLRVEVDNRDGSISFFTSKGKYLARDTDYSMMERDEGADKGSYIVKQGFRLDDSEPVYGLGILQDGKLSLRGKHIRMIQGNTEDFVPVVQSVKGYGIIWDNPSPTVFDSEGNDMSFESEVGECVDYYFIYGGNADKVIAGIRQLTGKVPMLPLWSYGFMQSRERYKSSAELLEVLDSYRAAGIPIDGMVQDWQYWGSNYLWNAMEFLNEDFANAQDMIDKVHDSNAHLMISIWSSFGPHTKQYREMKPKGLLLPFQTWPQSGLSSWPPRMDYPSGVEPYDAFSKEARDIYWNNLLRLAKMGIDAWWMDSTEPDHLSFKESDLELPTADGSFRSVRNAYPLLGVESVYDNQRAYTSDRRVCILTRSAYTGQQRTGANVWSGDVQSTWHSLRCQIPAGLGFALTGNPNFNTDLGGFFANPYNDRGKFGSGVHNPKFQELYVRWMQYGVFSPMMRSHGTEVPREIPLYGKPGDVVYDALVGAVKMRYSLLPYIYSTAWKVSSQDGTFQRALMMDFPSDRRGYEVANEFMFGDAFLVAPVVNAQYTEEKREFSSEVVDFTAPGKSTVVYLPAGTSWYDYYSGKTYKGGQEIEYETRFDRIPLFVRSGSIVPIGPDVQYSSEKPWDNLEIRVYAGQKGEFTLYEDEGDNYNYEKGMYSTIKFSLNGSKLTIGERQGEYEGMIANRTFCLVYYTSAGIIRKTVNYDGEKLIIDFKK